MIAYKVLGERNGVNMASIFDAFIFYILTILLSF